MQDSSKILIPSPPTLEQRVEELQQIQDQYFNRYNSEDLQDEMDKDVPGLFDKIVVASGRPTMISDLMEIEHSLYPVVEEHKNHFGTERPSELARHLGVSCDFDDLESAQTPSYPSGHTTEAFFFAHLLSELYPDLRDSLYELANAIAMSRIDRGVHFPSDIEGGKKLAKVLYSLSKSNKQYVQEGTIAKVRGYIKPETSFFTLNEWRLCVEMLLDLQKEGVDVRDGRHPDPRLNLILQKYFGYQLDVEVDRFDLLTEKNVLNFIEDFVNHRFWGFEKEFGHYFPNVEKLRFAYFYSRGDIEPYVLLDDEYTKQLYGSTNNPKVVMHYTTVKGLQSVGQAIEDGNDFDISTFTVAKRPFFRPEAKIILKLKGNVRAGFRSDIKSFAVDNGRRACNLYRLEYPGDEENNICYELDTCDGDVETSLWNEYIATPIEILEVMELKI